MVPDVIFIVKLNTGLKYLWKFHLSPHDLCQIVDIDVSLDRSIQYVCDKGLFDGSGSNFQSEIQQVWKFLSSPYVLWQGCQIVDIDVSLDSLLKKKYENIT